jgi:P4 family phage/plasmid primase-like protien
MTHLYPEHRKELEASVISPEIATARGYRSVDRPTSSDDRPRQELKRLGIPNWATEENRFFPGLLIPLYRPTGERISAMWKPRVPARAKDGKAMKYASVKGRASVLDVHPANRDRIVDITVPLWVTEGVKKADALTSQGLCVVALSGVYNWRSTMGSLGDWEDIPLRGRHVVICFDADARTNPNVLRAMVRFGRWLKSKGVKQTLYLIVPEAIDGTTVKGADDFLAAGGTLDQLRDAATTEEPRVEAVGDAYTDARLAETVADEVLDGSYCWAAALGWLQWDGRRWKRCSDVAVGEAVRQYSLARFGEAVEAARQSVSGADAAVDGWRSMLSAGRERSVIGLAKGIVERRAEDFDRHPDLLNTPNGAVDLETGDLLPHDPNLMMTKMAGAHYRPDATHSDWDKALEALPEDVRGYMQVRLGQAITGHMTPDDALVIEQGGGENGKSTLNETTARAVGDYFLLVSDRALMGKPGDHPTELMDFMGARYAVLEETPEARRLDPQRLKRTVGTPRITARHIRKDSVTFEATHSLFLSTNHRPLVEESDHGTWRRLLLVLFPYRFRKPHEPLEGPEDRHGDPGLRDRCKTNPEVWAAALAWLVEGARKWYAAGKVMPQPPDSVVKATRRWRAESDLVIAYADERLVIDRDAHVMSAELFDDFNEWVQSRGHHAWSERTLAARIGEHDEMRSNHVKKAVIRYRDGLSRRPLPSAYVHRPAPPARYNAWLGFRFATEEDVMIGEEVEPASSSGNTSVGMGGMGQVDEPKLALIRGSTTPPMPPMPTTSNASTLADEASASAIDSHPCPRCGASTYLSDGGADLICTQCNWWNAACEACRARPAGRNQYCAACDQAQDAELCPTCHWPLDSAGHSANCS